MFLIFLQTVCGVWLCKTDLLIPILTYFDKNKKSLVIVFLATNSYLRLPVLILSKMLLVNASKNLKKHSSINYLIWSGYEIIAPV